MPIMRNFCPSDANKVKKDSWLTLVSPRQVTLCIR